MSHSPICLNCGAEINDAIVNSWCDSACQHEYNETMEAAADEAGHEWIATSRHYNYCVNCGGQIMGPAPHGVCSENCMIEFETFLIEDEVVLHISGNATNNHQR